MSETNHLRNGDRAILMHGRTVLNSNLINIMSAQLILSSVFEFHFSFQFIFIYLFIFYNGVIVEK